MQNGYSSAQERQVIGVRTTTKCTRTMVGLHKNDNQRRKNDDERYKNDGGKHKNDEL